MFCVLHVVRTSLNERSGCRRCRGRFSETKKSFRNPEIYISVADHLRLGTSASAEEPSKHAVAAETGFGRNAPTGSWQEASSKICLALEGPTSNNMVQACGPNV